MRSNTVLLADLPPVIAELVRQLARDKDTDLLLCAGCIRSGHYPRERDDEWSMTAADGDCGQVVLSVYCPGCVAGTVPDSFAVFGRERA